MTPEQIRERVRAALPDARLELNGADCSFELLVVSERLAGQSLLARQRLVLGLFAAELATGELHALSIQARSPGEIDPGENSKAH